MADCTINADVVSQTSGNADRVGVLTDRMENGSLTQSFVTRSFIPFITHLLTLRVIN